MFSSNGTQVAADNAFIEDVFSTDVYVGNSGTKTIINEIDLSTKGGLVWVKWRSGDVGSGSHTWVDTARGVNKVLIGNDTDAEFTQTTVSAFNTTGFTLSGDGGGKTNYISDSYVSWTFRKQPKFFDIVTFTGNGTTGRTIAHNLGSVPGCIMVKRTDSTSNWTIYHREDASRAFCLNNKDGAYGTPCWGSVAPTSTTFTVSLESAAGTARQININSATYVAYLFANDAGGFGLSGMDNVISCGSYPGNGSATGPVVTLGYEPQWLMIKKYLPENPGITGDWQMLDVMRGFSVMNESFLSATDTALLANRAYAETDVEYVSPTATGFQITSTDGQVNSNGETYIYIAIRRGPMRVPTLATTFYGAQISNGNSSSVTRQGFGGVAPDLIISSNNNSTTGTFIYDKLRGKGRSLKPSTTATEVKALDSLTGFTNAGFTAGSDSVGRVNGSGLQYIYNVFRRAPGFFDIVCYKPSTTADLIYHNLGVVPEMIIAKNRGTTATQWYINHAAMGATNEIYFNTGAVSPGGTWTKTSTYWNNSSALYPTGESHVAYLFATCPGVSKVGSYTGTATTNQINCGFTAGARFVLIKRTDSTGDWYFWDSERGIVAGDDPYRLLNSDLADVTNTDYIDPYSPGFQLSSTAPAAINASGGTFIFLAIA